MEYKFKSYSDLIDDEKCCVTFLEAFIANTIDDWDLIAGYQDEFRNLYTHFKQNNPNIKTYDNPIDDSYFIACLGFYFYDENEEYESVNYILGYENPDTISEYAIICKIKDEYKHTFEELVPNMDCYYLADNTLHNNIIPELIKQLKQISDKSFCLYVDVYNQNTNEKELLERLNFEEVKFHSKNYEKIHMDYNINLEKYKRFKLIIQ